MQWLIGIDLGGRSNGALEVASWLMRTAKEPAHFVAVHVLDERRWGPREVTQTLRPAAQKALERELAAAGLPPERCEASVVVARSVTDGLADAGFARAYDGMILGRAAPSRERAIVRLGAVARRLLRRLPIPVVVAPPDFSAASAGVGPILLGTDLEGDAVGAGRMAGKIADDLGRALLVVHVDPSYVVVPDYVGGGAVVIPRAPSHVRADVESWARTCGVDSPRIRLGDGPIVEELLAQAERESSPMLVVGSRQLSLTERIFSSSVASDLARLADRPVLVVPPGG